MQVKRTLFTSVVTVALAVTLAAPGQAADKPAEKAANSARQGTSASSVVAADAGAAALAPAAVSSAVRQASSTLQSRVVSFVKANGTKHTFATYTNELTGKVVLETDASASVVSSLVGSLGGVVEVRKAKLTDTFSRRDDTPPFWGGGGITLAAPTPRCSTGYSVKNIFGTRFMVTAGHCFTNGQIARTELGNRVVGTVFGNGLPSQDMELISGQSYGTSIFIGGVNSSSGAHVASAADPVVGFANYCHSGRTTGENCGHRVVSNFATVCTTSGCKSPVTAFTGGFLPQGGDSGSPFYANSVAAPDKHIRGHIIAGNGVTSYAEKWSRVAARYGVSIVT
jgi:hypothetical protein